MYTNDVTSENENLSFDIFSVIEEMDEEEERKSRYFYHETYKANFLKRVQTAPDRFIQEVYPEDKEHSGKVQRDAHGNPVKPVYYDRDETVICCPNRLSL